MGLISKSSFFNAYPYHGAAKAILIRGREPSLSHLLCLAHDIIKKETDPNDRARLYNIVDFTYQSKSYPNCYLFQLVIAIVNYFKKRGFLTEFQLYDRICDLRAQEPKLLPTLQNKSDSLEASSKKEETPTIVLQPASPAPAPAILIEQIAQNLDPTNREPTPTASPVTPVMLPSKLEAPEVPPSPYTPPTAKPLLENFVKKILVLPPAEIVEAVPKMRTGLEGRGGDETAIFAFQKLNVPQAKALVHGLFNRETPSFTLFLNILVGIDSLPKMDKRLSIIGKLMQLIVKQQHLANYRTEGHCLYAYLFSVHASRKEKAVRAFRDAYLEITLRQKKSQTVETLLISLWKQDAMLFKINLDLHFLSLSKQTALRSWAKKKIPELHLPLVDAFEDQPLEAAVETFLAKRRDIAELKKLFCTLHAPDFSLTSNFGHNFLALQRSFTVEELKKWAQSDLFLLDTTCGQDKLLALFREMDSVQAYALVAGYSAQKQSLLLFQNLLKGCLFVKDKDLVIKLFVKILALPAAREYLEQIKDDAALTKYVECALSFLNKDKS